MRTTKSKKSDAKPTKEQISLLRRVAGFTHCFASDAKATRDLDALAKRGWLSTTTQSYLDGNARVGDRNAVTTRTMYRVTQAGRDLIGGAA